MQACLAEALYASLSPQMSGKWQNKEQMFLQMKRSQLS